MNLILAYVYSCTVLYHVNKLIGLTIMLFMYELMYFHEMLYCVKYLFTRTNDQKGGSY